MGGVAAGPATAGGAEAAAGAGAGVERGEGGAGAILETKGSSTFNSDSIWLESKSFTSGGTGVTRGIAKGQGQGLEAAAEAVEELLICRPLDVPHYLDWNICSPSTYTLA